MDIKFWLIQLIGIVAWLILVLSYYRKKENHIIILQVIATIFYCIHYLFLGAYSGLVICLFEVIRDYLYYKTDKDREIFLYTLPVYLIWGIIIFKNKIELLPILSSLIDGNTLFKKRLIIVCGAIISYTVWVIYDIFVKSYSGAVTDGIIAISNISILLFDKKLLKNSKRYEKVKKNA